MLDAVESAACVDTARVYATGLSMGGMMSSLLACYEPGRFAAVGLVSGIVHPDGCSTSRAVPIVVFWGKQDVVLPYCGGVGPVISALLSGTPIAGLPPPACPPADFLGFPPVEEVVGDWAATDGCSSEPASSPAAEHVELRAYGGCKNDATVEFYVIADGSHAWPGSAVMAAIGASPAGAIIGHTNDEIDASTLIWRFFQRYALPR
jgi:polyhydroxybutyrate depolymerase